MLYCREGEDSKSCFTILDGTLHSEWNVEGTEKGELKYICAGTSEFYFQRLGYQNDLKPFVACTRHHSCMNLLEVSCVFPPTWPSCLNFLGRSLQRTAGPPCSIYKFKAHFMQQVAWRAPAGTKVIYCFS